jgi:hypothetical protein
MAEEKSESAKKQEDWMNTKWRPMMGWMYMVVCMADFVLFPVLWSIIQVQGGGEVKMQWNPITLQGAGLFHMAMGAILGIAAYGRTQEKLNDKAGVLAQQPNQPMMQQTNYEAPVAPTRRTVSTSTTVDYAQPVVGYGGKLAPPPAYQPEL